MAHLISAVVLILLVSVIGYLIVSHQRKIWIERNKLQNVRLEQQQELTRAIIRAQENERERIARDLHDDIGALAVSLKLNNESLKDNLDNTEKLKKIIEKNENLANSIIKAGRHVSHDLLPPVLRRDGLVSALKALTDDLSNPDKTMIHFQCDKNEIRMDELAEISIYRVIKEWMHNVIKHADATELSINLICTNDKLQIKTIDNGKGFEFEKVKNTSKGLGLMNIEGRLNDLNANYKFSNHNGSGTELSIEYNLHNSSDG